MKTNDSRERAFPSFSSRIQLCEHFRIFQDYLRYLLQKVTWNNWHKFQDVFLVVHVYMLWTRNFKSQLINQLKNPEFRRTIPLDLTALPCPSPLSKFKLKGSFRPKLRQLAVYCCSSSQCSCLTKSFWYSC